MTVFDPLFHVRVLPYSAAQRVEWAMAAILQATPRAVKSIQQLESTVYGYPEPQFVLSFVEAADRHYAVPVDCRGVGGGICTIHIAPAMRWGQLARAIRDAPNDVSACNEAGNTITTAHEAHRLHMHNAHGPLHSPLPMDPLLLQWIFAVIRPPTPPMPADSSCSLGEDNAGNGDRASEAGKGAEDSHPHVDPSVGAEPSGSGSRAGPSLAARDAVSVATPMGRRNLPPAPRAEHHDTPLLPECHLRIAAQHLSNEKSKLFQHDCLGLANLHRDTRRIQPLHASTAAALRTLPCWDSTKTSDAARIFTDGSYQSETGNAAWAFCVLVRQDQEWRFGGFASGRIDPSDGPSRLNAHIAELHALFAALLTAGSMLGHEIVMHYDAKAAANMAQALAWSKDLDQLSLRVTLLTDYAKEQVSNLTWHHVPSHTGEPFNELVDVAAKRAAEGKFEHAPFRSLMSRFLSQQEFHWLWLKDKSKSPNSAWPVYSDELEAGAIMPDQSTQPEICTWPSDDSALSVPPAREEGLYQWNLNLMTYNALSLKNPAQRQVIASQGASQGIHIIGVQESRYTPDNVISRQGPYTVIAGPDDAGHLGCQLWLRNDVAIASNGTSQIFLDPTKASIIRAEPRLLVVLLETGKQGLACIVGHGPTAATETDLLVQWWSKLDSALRAIPHKYRPIVLLDANARFAEGHSSIMEAQPATTPGRLLVQLAKERALACTSLQDQHGRHFTTWTGPMSKGACIDYILVPNDCEYGLITTGAWTSFPSIHGPDHFPLRASVSWQEAGKCSHRHVQVDRQAMLTPAGRETIQHIFDTAPQLPWHAHADDYLAAINTHVSRGLVAAFPRQTKQPRQLHISDKSWQWIRYRRELRRQLFRATQKHGRHILRACWNAWRRAHPAPHRLGNEWSMLKARICKLIRTANSAVRTCMRQDAAAYARHSMLEARQEGPSALARQLRGILKIGRAYKPVRTSPSLVVNGALVTGSSEVSAAFAQHFAKAERARPCSRAQLQGAHARAHHTPGTNISAKEVPTLVELAGRFARLQVNKACGFSKIPAEAFKAAPLAAAKLHMPLLLRMAMGREPPFLWVGGHCVPIPKPNKPPLDLSGWRSVMLLEPACKAVGQAFRPAIVQQFMAHALPVQCGAQKGVPISLPMQYIRTHLALLEAQKTSGAILFVDATNAYYSIIRHFLFAHGDICGQQALCSAVEAIHPDPCMQRQLLAALAGPGLLHTSPAPVQNYVRSVLAHAWFSTKPLAEHLCETNTGTSPGAPLADVLFQLIFSTAMKSIQDQIREHDLEAVLPSGETAPAPTWADDLAVPCMCNHAREVLPRVIEIAGITRQAMKRVGLAMNFSPGKSEALVVWRGAEASNLRRQYFGEAHPHVQVPLEDGEEAKLTLTREYLHLGGIVNDKDTYREDILHRQVHAQVAFHRLRRTLLHSPHLSPREKSQLFTSLVLGRFLHGVGQWKMSRADELLFCSIIQKWHRCLVRPIANVSAKGLTAEQICQVTGCLPAETLLHAARVAQLHVVVTQGEGYLWKALLLAEGWLAMALNSLHVALRQTQQDFAMPQDVGDALQHLKGNAEMLRLLPSRYKQRVAHQQGKHRTKVLEKAVFLASLDEEGGCAFTIRPDQGEKKEHCPECGIRCATPAALASHRRKRHGIPGTAACIQGTSCMACRMEFWTTPRLRLHLRKQSACMARHAASDVSYMSWEYTANLALTRRPAMVTLGPQPFWATMMPAPETVQVATQDCNLSVIWEAMVKHSNAASLFFLNATRIFSRMHTLPDIEDLLEHSPVGGTVGQLKVRLLADLLRLSACTVHKYQLGESGCSTQGLFTASLQGQAVVLTVAGGG